MLALISLLAMQAIPGNDTQTEITVIGQRLERWSGKYEIRGNRMKCSTKATTGDSEIDALGCKAFDTCADLLAARITASDDKSLATDVRLSMKAAIKQDLSTCVAGERKTLISQLADKRAGG